MKSKFGEKIKIKLKLYGNLLIILAVVLFVISLARNIFKIFEAKKRVEEIRQRVEKLKSENALLGKKLDEVKSQEYIEKQLRDKLGLAKEGETVVVLPDEEILRQIATQTIEEEDYLPDPTWKKWLKLFI